MDALSVLLQNVHLFETKYYRLHGAGDWSFTIDRQDAILFYVVLSGSFFIDAGDEVRQTHAGDTIMLSNSSHHKIYALDHHSHNAYPIDHILTRDSEETVEFGTGGSNTVSMILIECQYEKEIMLPLLSVLPSVLPEVNADSNGRFEVVDVEIRLLTLESQRERMGKTAVINHWASIMMIESLRTYIEQLPDATDSWLSAMKDPFLTKAIAAMHHAPEHSWTIHGLAEVAGMSRSSFAQRFKDVIGMPPLTYLTDYRLRLAARYLRLQQNSISRIGELVGYASDSTFSQAFKRVYGISPKAYRQRYSTKSLSLKD